jgi:hypothetical protein
MLEVETNHKIILLFFDECLSIRKIAKKLKINARTVSSRIKEYEQFKASPYYKNRTALMRWWSHWMFTPMPVGPTLWNSFGNWTRYLNKRSIFYTQNYLSRKSPFVQ